MKVAPTLDEERELWQKGFFHICGVDEVGRGSWAGPVVVGAVIFPQEFQVFPGLFDSKQLLPAKREQVAREVKRQALSFATCEIGVPVIDRVGIGEATQIAFRKVIRELSPKPDFILIDSFYIKYLNRSNQKPIKKGDEKSASIAAASVIAKVYRDELMRKLASSYPEYGFEEHKGYGTKKHQKAIRKNGFSDIHRRSFNLNFLQPQNL